MSNRAEETHNVSWTWAAEKALESGQPLWLRFAWSPHTTYELAAREAAKCLRRGYRVTLPSEPNPLTGRFWVGAQRESQEDRDD